MYVYGHSVLSICVSASTCGYDMWVMWRISALLFYRRSSVSSCSGNPLCITDGPPCLPGVYLGSRNLNFGLQTFNHFNHWSISSALWLHFIEENLKKKKKVWFSSSSFPVSTVAETTIKLSRLWGLRFSLTIYRLCCTFVLLGCCGEVGQAGPSA